MPVTQNVRIRDPDRDPSLSRQDTDGNVAEVRGKGDRCKISEFGEVWSKRYRISSSASHPQTVPDLCESRR